MVFIEMHNRQLFCIILYASLLISGGSGLHIISRREWGAALTRRLFSKITKPVPHVILHHTEQPTLCSGDSCKNSIRAIQKYHFSRGYSDIGYSFLIGTDGQIYEGRGWGVVGAHTYGYNRNGYGKWL
ncbi:Peptidoglycan recognition protein 5 [Fasciola gigantica]|uniref:Peptidoglycan recognition protein 5 n=1 Tax=Fasciola gigantica TaxID=46835 RepID=A0A504YXU2_FASGI|nr:Peptidoglycan recognition protein 5 [Fasciola gigantica]